MGETYAYIIQYESHGVWYDIETFSDMESAQQIGPSIRPPMSFPGTPEKRLIKRTIIEEKLHLDAPRVTREGM